MNAAKLLRMHVELPTGTPEYSTVFIHFLLRSSMWSNYKSQPRSIMYRQRRGRYSQNDPWGTPDTRGDKQVAHGLASHAFGPRKESIFGWSLVYSWDGAGSAPCAKGCDGYGYVRETS